MSALMDFIFYRQIACDTRGFRLASQSSVALELATSFVVVRDYEAEVWLKAEQKIGKIWRDGKDRINVLMNSMGVQCTDVAFENGESETENQLKDFQVKEGQKVNLKKWSKGSEHRDQCY